MKILLHTYQDRKEIEVETDLIDYITPGYFESRIHFLDKTLSIRVHEDIEEIKKIIKARQKEET